MPIYSPPLPGMPAAGNYVFTCSPSSVTTAQLASGALRLAPMVITRSLTIDRIGAEVTTIGDVGSKVRLGIYADTGYCLPGALVLDAGTINGDSATVQEITVAVTLSPGVYWFGSAAQVISSVAPTLRVTNNWHPPVPVGPFTSAPTAAQAGVGYAQTSVTGALPSTFTASPSIAGATARVHVRAA